MGYVPPPPPRRRIPIPYEGDSPVPQDQLPPIKSDRLSDMLSRRPPEGKPKTSIRSTRFDDIYGDLPSLASIVRLLLSLLHLRVSVTVEKPKRKVKNDELTLDALLLGDDGELVEDARIERPAPIKSDRIWE